MKWLHFILSHSIFVAVCAFALCMQTFILLKLPVDYLLCLFVFFATLSSYNFYWLISKYRFNEVTGLMDFFKKQKTGIFFFLAASAGAFYCLSLRPGIIPQSVIAVLLTLLYSLPLWPVKLPAFIRSAGFVKTLLLAFTWTYVTLTIPLQDGLFISSFSAGLLFTARFLFMLMLSLIFDSRDVKLDKIRSLNSLATAVSQKTLALIMTAVFICYLATGFFLRFYLHETVQVAAFLVTGIVTLLVYRLSLKEQGYYFYYFLVDGLMLFSAAASFVASI